MSVLEQWTANVMNTYGSPSLALVSGSGATVVDEAGRSYVDLLGGIISVESVPRAGTTFRIRLPVPQAARQETAVLA